MKLFHYPNCSTCKQAVRWLAAHGIAFEAVHIVQQPPTVAQLKQVLQLSGAPMKKLFNTAGQSYRQGGFKTKLANMSDAEAFAALSTDGMLIKRPLLLGKAVALIGFKSADWTAALT